MPPCAVEAGGGELPVRGFYATTGDRLKTGDRVSGGAAAFPARAPARGVTAQRRDVG